MRTYPNGKYNWEYIVREYAKSEDILFVDAMRFLSQRASLQGAVELLGVEVMPQNDIVKSINAEKILNDFGKYLDIKGYTVPQLYEPAYLQQNILKGQPTHSHKPIYTMFKGVNMDWVFEDVVQFDQMWNDGFSVSEIAKTLGRTVDEVGLLAYDRAEKEKIHQREGGVFGKSLQHA